MNIPRLVTPMPQVKSNIFLPSSKSTQDPLPFVIIPCVILPMPWLMCLTPNACQSVFVCNPLRGTTSSLERNLEVVVFCKHNLTDMFKSSPGPVTDAYG